MTKFDRCLAITLKHEGGWSDHPSDHGGATMRGVTIETYAQFKGRGVAKDELRNISDADLRAIYRRNYWDKVRGDDLPPGLDLVAFDAAVNSGPSRGVKWLQSAVFTTQDGKMGPNTLAAARQSVQMLGADAVIKSACDARMGFLRGLKTWPTFGKGWTSRVEDIRAKATAMAESNIDKINNAPETGNPTSKPSLISAILSFLSKLLGCRK